MTTLRRAACIAVVCLAAVPATAVAGAKQDALVAHVNFARQVNGLAPLAASPHLHRSASRVSRQLMRANSFAHPGSIQAGGGFRALGEALRFHLGKRPRYATTVQAWLASPSHRALVLSPAFTHVGAGIARGIFAGRPSTIWALHLGGY